MAKSNAKTKTKPKPEAEPPEPFKFPVLTLVQGDLTMYAFVATADVLRKFCVVSRREEDQEKG